MSDEMINGDVMTGDVVSADGPPGQKWPDCDADVTERVRDVLAVLRDVAADTYVGGYLHGSLATGCYYPPKSDIDILAVVSQPLTPDAREAIARSVAEQELHRQPVGGVEMSVITRDVAAAPVNPAPYEVHYSETWQERILAGQVDWADDDVRDGDLAAHLTMIRHRGIALDGPPVAEIIGSVPWEDYVFAVLDDFDWIVADDHIQESPYYGVLNICRTVELVSGARQRTLSKEEGALWALENFPETHHPIIRHALRVYRSPKPVTARERVTNGEEWDAGALTSLRDYARAEVARRDRRDERYDVVEAAGPQVS